MRGFTLIELLVVITIIVTTGVLLLPRLGQFQDTQDLENGAEKVLSSLKQTQSNAVSGASCGDQFSPTLKAIDWRIIFQASSVVVEPSCTGVNPVNLPRSSQSLESGVTVSRVNFDNGVRSSDPVDLSAAPDGRAGSTASFSNIAGVITFQDSAGLPVLNYKRMIAVLQVSGRPDKIGVFIEQGGLLYTGAVR